jgi:hypothetical protein
MSRRSIIPAYKDDQDALSALAKADEAQIMVAADELLEWLQDGNWPVSLPIGEVLAQYVDQLAPKLVSILQGYDSAWKYWCIRFLLMNLELTQIPASIRAELTRIVLSPTANDIAEEAAGAAEELLTGAY